MKEKKMVFIRRNMQTLALVRDCSSLWDMGKGLIGSPEPGSKGNVYEGMLLRIPSYRQRFSGLINSVHMIGMRFPVSVFWIRGNKVVDRTYAEPGFHIYSPSCSCSEVLELPADALDVISNVQIGTENQFVLHYSLHQSANDQNLLEAHIRGFKNRHGKYPETVIADSGYGNLENYIFL